MAVAPLPISVFRLLECSTEEVSSGKRRVGKRRQRVGR